MAHKPIDRLGMDICEMFGVDPNDVTRITIDVPAASIPHVVFTMPVYEPAPTARLTEFLRRYKLTEAKWDCPWPPPAPEESS